MNPVKPRKKLIETALPLDAINAASAREKSIRHGHPSTLHLWWARRPLAAARAVLFAQLVDDPSAWPELFPTEAAQQRERERLFRIIEHLVVWEHTTNEEVLERARCEIRRSWARHCLGGTAAERLSDDEIAAAIRTGQIPPLPGVHDPFAGGGSIPLEAQRLGLEAYASDLNPVAVTINKAMIEIPPKFRDCPPVNPQDRQQLDLNSWYGAQGLAADVRYYGQWMREQAQRRIGHLYPPITITPELAADRPDLRTLIGQQLTVIAWLWARTVRSPNPAFAHVEVPLVTTFILSSKPGHEAYVEPVVAGDTYRFTVRVGTPPAWAKQGTKLARGAQFRCLLSGMPISGNYIKAEGQAGRMGAQMLAIVAEGSRGRVYLPPTDEQEAIARSAQPTWKPEGDVPARLTGGTCVPYGLSTWGDLFTPRQLVALTTFADLVGEAMEQVKRDYLEARAGTPASGLGTRASGAPTTGSLGAPATDHLGTRASGAPVAGIPGTRASGAPTTGSLGTHASGAPNLGTRASGAPSTGSLGTPFSGAPNLGTPFSGALNLGTRASGAPTTGSLGTPASGAPTTGSLGTPASGAPNPSTPASGSPLKPPRGWHSRGYHPHLDAPEVVQSITFRLADSVPAALLTQWREELGLVVAEQRHREQNPTTAAHHRRPQPGDDRHVREAELRKRIERYEDAGHGACWLRDPRIAELVEHALLHFDGERYRLLEWCIMPNHVHVLIETLPGYPPGDVVRSWKTFTAREANQLLDRTGSFWMVDYFDRCVRDERHLAAVRAYIRENPVKAGLCATAEEWRWGSAWAGWGRNLEAGRAGDLRTQAGGGGDPRTQAGQGEDPRIQGERGDGALPQPGDAQMGWRAGGPRTQAGQGGDPRTQAGRGDEALPQPGDAQMGWRAGGPRTQAGQGEDPRTQGERGDGALPQPGDAQMGWRAGGPRTQAGWAGGPRTQDDDVPLHQGGTGATAYAQAVGVYLALAVSKNTHYWCALSSWHSGGEKMQGVFARQAIPMIWDFAENNPLCNASGSLIGSIAWNGNVLENMQNVDILGRAKQGDAAKVSMITDQMVISTDPPYYDNIGYADLSDFFYVWLRRMLRPIFPDLYATLSTPKAEELVATPYRHGSKEAAERFFMEGMTRALHNLAEQAHPAFPVTIYYAFKQQEVREAQRAASTTGELGDPAPRSSLRSAPSSTGWETFLEAVIQAGFAVTGTWPIRTEMQARSISRSGTNALASSIVLVCRPRPADAPIATRREFINALKAELPTALAVLQHANIAPVDLAQAAIGLGMAIYTRSARVVDAQGTPVRVREALTLINQVLDEVLAEQESDFDADTRWALAWFEQHGFAEGDFGVAETLSKAKNTSIEGLAGAGILEAKRGRVRLLKPAELTADWDPARDTRFTHWEAVHHLIRVLETGGEMQAAEMAAKLGSRADVARELAYRLYTICERKKRPDEAFAYNALVQSWGEIARLALDRRSDAPVQMSFEE
jgi:adenine-specific DNA methylase/REP element-mobilizing transposase RayT